MLTEAAYLMRHRPALVTSLFRSVQGKFLQILPLEEGDLAGINSIRIKYEDQRFDLADACLMYLAEREGLRHIVTLDGDFRVFQKTDGSHLSLVPILGVSI